MYHGTERIIIMKTIAIKHFHGNELKCIYDGEWYEIHFNNKIVGIPMKGSEQAQCAFTAVKHTLEIIYE
jgi:hypothetical protein